MKIFTELTPECDITAQMYASGLEKKEIALIKCKAVSTINNQLQTAFSILNVKNGRELAMKLCERLSGIRFTLDFSPAVRSVVACCLLMILVVNHNFEMRRQNSTRRINVKLETVAHSRIRARGRDIPL